MKNYETNPRKKAAKPEPERFLSSDNSPPIINMELELMAAKLQPD